MNDFILEKILTEQKKNLLILENLISNSIRNGDALLSLIQKGNHNDDDHNNYFESISQKLSQYQEDINLIYDHNCNKSIKNGINIIKENINNFIKKLKGNKATKSFNNTNPFDNEELKMTDFYRCVEEFSDETQARGLIEDIERTKRNINFYYEFSFASTKKIKLDRNNLKISLLETITKNEESLIISYGNEKNYIHNAIKSDKFSYNNIEAFNNIEEINEVKEIIDYFIGRENTDYKGNAKHFNSSQNIKRGTEIYDPPYGFTAIGRNVVGKYESNEWLTNKTRYSKWANSYHPIFDAYSIRTIFVEGLKPGKFQEFAGKDDIRHPGDKIPKGIYLFPKIKIAEDKAKTIVFNNKKYKFILMVKVKISEISEPKNVNYWILTEKNARVYRLLFKEV